MRVAAVGRVDELGGECQNAEPYLPPPPLLASTCGCKGMLRCACSLVQLQW